MNEKQKQCYIDNPSVCPYCEDGELNHMELEADSNIITQPIECSCGKKWTDIFKLVGIKT